MKTKGALMWGVGEDWNVEEIELGDPAPGEVMVELAASGLCHSDEHLRTGSLPIPFPALGGHEGAGIITKVGAGVTDLQEGDHIVTAFIPACGRCRSCNKGQQNLCDMGAFLLTGQAISDSTYRVQARGKDVIVMSLLGTFSPYITVNEASVVKIDPDVNLEVAALVGCGVTTGWGSATRVAQVSPGDTVVIMGAGGVGMNAVQAAAISGAKRVMVIDPVESKRKWALDFGATHTFASAEEALPVLIEVTWGSLADKVIVTVGEIHGEDVQIALGLTGKGGRTVVTGMGDCMDIDVKMSLFELTMYQKDLQGAIFGGCNPRNEIPALLSMYREGKLNLDGLITNTYDLEGINQGYQDMREGKNIRGLIKYDSSDR